MILVTVSIRTPYGRSLQIVSAENETDFAQKMGRIPYPWVRVNSAQCPSALQKAVEIPIELDF